MQSPSRLPEPDFRLLFESVPGLYLVLTPEFVIVAASDAYLRATMTTREGIVGGGIFEVFPDNPRDPNATGVANLRASLERVRQSGLEDTMAVQRYDIQVQGQEDFEARYWSPINSPVFGPDGKVAFIIHRVEDVTAFVQLRLAKTEQEEIAHGLRSETERMEAEIYRRAQELQTANNTVRLLNETLERRVAERTESLRKTEEKLLHSQKMEALARLTGGIAHDFNNMLAVIINSNFMLKEVGELNEEQAKIAAQVDFAAQRAAALTRQLLIFSHQQVTQVRSVEWNAVVVEMQSMLRRLVGEHIEFRTQLCEQSTLVRADRSRLDQVLANLVVNARDAMPRGGTIGIETARITIDALDPQTAPELSQGTYVVLSVSDTGVGMSPETKARVFEPFFTTKGVGRGTGLGLSTVHGIVTQAGGHVWVYSELDRGTVFKVYWPADTADSAAKEDSQLPVAVRNGSETVLLVEDEALLRSATSTLLRARGYRVLVAADGVEALRLCESHPDAIDLVATDVIMPGLDGKELARRLQALRPSLKVLFMSGYTDQVLREGSWTSDMGFVQKPFSPNEFLSEVRRVLDGAPSH